MGTCRSKVHSFPALSTPTESAASYDSEQARIVDALKGFDYDVDALVLEGGGAKAAGQIGAIQVLKDVGVLQRMTRFAGTSAGALIAAMLAMDHEPADIRRIHERMRRGWFMDAEGAYCAFLPNIVGKLGWNPGLKVVGVMHEVVMRKTGKPDITFLEIYQRYKKELCVVAVNLSTMSVEYYHPKLSPNMSLVTALRSSISIPILLQPVQAEGSLMVDGGVLCKFPLHAFDGWCLSMDPQDSFFNKIDAGEDPFGKFNDKVIGITVTNFNDKIFQRQFSLEDTHLIAWDTPVYPNTKLARERSKTLVKQKDHLYKQRQLLVAGKEFAGIARAANWSIDGVVEIADLKKVFTNTPLPSEDAEILFGPKADIMTILLELEADAKLRRPGFVAFDEFIHHLRARGVAFRSFMAGSMMANIDSFTDLVKVIITAMSGFSRMYFQKDRDDGRTININVGYIDTTDFEMENEDREYIIQQGVNSTLLYLRGKMGLPNNIQDTEGIYSTIESEVHSIRL